MTPNDQPTDSTVQAGLDFDVSNLRLELQTAGQTLKELAWRLNQTPQPATIRIPIPSAN
jgi:hypothetical protein